MEKGFKPLTVEDFGLTPKDLEILVKGSQIFAGPTETEDNDPTNPANEPDESSDNADRKP